jgi:polyether ionophore transport system permease protein
MTIGRAELMVGRLAYRRVWRGAVAVAVSGVLVTVTAVLGYVAAYPDPADRVTLARSIGANPGLTALFGETRSLETVAGFTEWRVVLVMALVGAVWGLFATTRILRGEEDAGRAEVLLAGPLTRSDAARSTLTGLAAALLLMLMISVVGIIAGSGHELGTGRAATLGLTLTSAPALMLGVGAITSQLAESRRKALGLGAGVLGVFYLLRVLADSDPDLRWLRWATPLGWLELARPLTDPNLVPVLLSYLLAAALAGLAVVLVRARDTGAGLLAERGSGRVRRRGLDSPLALAVRLGEGSARSWALGLALAGMLIGLVARTAAEAMAKSRGGDLFGDLGIAESGTRAYVGIFYIFITVALAVAASGQVAATRDEEAGGQLDNLLAGPVPRARWLAGRVMVAAGTLALGASAAVAGTWAAGSAGGLGVSVGDLCTAGLNTLPAALFVLGAGTLLHGLVPRLAVPLTYALVTASFLLEVVGASVNLPSWVLNLSVLHHVAPAPAVSPDWRAAAMLVMLALALAALGALALGRRDIEPT